MKENILDVNSKGGSAPQTEKSMNHAGANAAMPMRKPGHKHDSVTEDARKRQTYLLVFSFFVLSGSSLASTLLKKDRASETFLP